MFVFEDTLSPKVDAKLTKAFKKHVAAAEEKKLLKQQTEMFWYLQLQMLSMPKDSEFTFEHFTSIRYCNYKRNKFTRKIDKLLYNRDWMCGWTDEEYACLCTHFALQLAGIEE